MFKLDFKSVVVGILFALFVWPFVVGLIAKLRTK